MAAAAAAAAAAQTHIQSVTTARVQQKQYTDPRSEALKLAGEDWFRRLSSATTKSAGTSAECCTELLVTGVAPAWHARMTSQVTW